MNANEEVTKLCVQVRAAYIHPKLLESLLEISCPSFSLQLIGYHVRMKLCKPKLFLGS